MLKTGTTQRVKKRVRFAEDQNPRAEAKLPFSERFARFHALQTANMFLANYGEPLKVDPKIKALFKITKANFEYKTVLSPSNKRQNPNKHQIKNALAKTMAPQSDEPAGAKTIPAQFVKSKEKLNREREEDSNFPSWHAPWRLKRVISGHYGWVRAVAVDVSNDWFITGSNDRTIKIWDLATGSLKLTLTGHTTAVRGLCVSDRHPYIFSCGEDKTVRCWDFEQNKVIRKYHGHLSGVYDLSLHPSLDVLVSVGRDASARVWDVRTKAQIFVLTGHKSTVACVQTQQYEPQVVTGSHDHTIRLWDLKKGVTSSTLTHHKKSIRDLLFHFAENTFVSAAADSVRVWKCPRGDYLRTLSASEGIINTMSLNKSNVLVTGGDNGEVRFWDYPTGYNFQTVKAPPQPGSLDSEAGIFASAFDVTGSRLITCEADKTIKIWKEDEQATPETHPVLYQPRKSRRPLL